MNKLFFTLLLLALATYAQQERVAIIQTLDNNDSIGFQNLLYLTDKLRETAVKILPNERFGVMTTESIIAFLGSQERAVKACNESSCLAELGRMVSADYVAQGRIGRFGNDLTIKVELYNVKTGTLMDSFTGDSKDIYGLRDIIDGKAPDLFKKMLNTSNVKKTETPPVVATPVPTPKPQYTPPVEPEAPIVKNDKEGERITRQILVRGLIEEGVEKNKEEIKKESLYMHPYERELLYEENEKKTVAGYVALNIIPGGLGSYLQGDIKFGVIQSSLVVLAMYFAWTPHSGGEIIGIDEDVLANVTLGISCITGFIRPLVYKSKQNKALKEALNINDDYEVNVKKFSLSIDPLVIPKDGTPAVGLAFNVRY